MQEAKWVLRFTFSSIFMFIPFRFQLNIDFIFLITYCSALDKRFLDYITKPSI